MALVYSVSVAGISVVVLAMAIGLIEGMMASVMAKSVFHCAAVSGSSVGNGGKGAALGETGWVVSVAMVVDEGVIEGKAVSFQGCFTLCIDDHAARLIMYPRS
jgi:hypothetical protein